MGTKRTNQENARTILVVEDSPTQAAHLRSLLEHQGLRVLWASDGQQGVQMAQESFPDLIVLDLQMPQMNGLQVCQRLKESDETGDIPIIIFTRHDDSETIMLGMRLGVTDYIPKDAFSDTVLVETLRQMGLIIS